MHHKPLYDFKQDEFRIKWFINSHLLIFRATFFPSRQEARLRVLDAVFKSIFCVDTWDMIVVIVIYCEFNLSRLVRSPCSRVDGSAEGI